MHLQASISDRTTQEPRAEIVGRYLSIEGDRIRQKQWLGTLPSIFSFGYATIGLFCNLIGQQEFLLESTSGPKNVDQIHQTTFQANKMATGSGLGTRLITHCRGSRLVQPRKLLALISCATKKWRIHMVHVECWALNASHTVHCMQRHTYVHTQRHTYVHTQRHTYVHTQRHTYVHTQRHTYVHTQRHTYVCTHISHVYTPVFSLGF